MTLVSHMFHAAPMVAPAPGFAERVQARLEYRQERRRRVLIGLLLGFGALAMLLLALPAILSALWVAGRLLLPYSVVAYAESLSTWLNAALGVLGDTASVLVRFIATNPAAHASLGAGAIAGAASVLWVRLVVRQRAKQR
jgi:hypothetical protein